MSNENLSASRDPASTASGSELLARRGDPLNWRCILLGCGAGAMAREYHRGRHRRRDARSGAGVWQLATRPAGWSR
jgi:hypothetical protein